MRSNSPPHRGRSMGKHEIIEDTRAPPEAEGSGAPASEPPASKTSKMALEASEIAAPRNEAAAGEGAATTVPPQADIEQRKPSRRKDAADAEEALPGAGEETPRVSRFALLAAALALAAALGAMVGALAAYGIARPAGTAAGGGRTGMAGV